MTTLDGVTIHAGHPFADPDSERDPVRRFRGARGRRGVAVDDRGWASARTGLTVSSLMVAAGEPARVLALLDPDSDLAEALDGDGRAVVHLLSRADRDLAEMFAGTAPAPGGVFAHAAFEDTDWGPRLGPRDSWAGVRVEEVRRRRLVVAGDRRGRARRGRGHRRPAGASPGTAGSPSPRVRA